VNGPAIAEFGALLPLVFTEDTLNVVLLKLDRGGLDMQVVRHASVPDRMMMLVGKANSDGWLLDLVKAVALERPNSPEVTAFVRNYPYLDPARNPVSTNPWDAHQIFGGKLFIGRLSLRKYLKKIEQPVGRKVLVVTSACRHIGKTYTTDLIRFVAQQRPLNKLTYIDLDLETYDPGSLAHKLASDWNVDQGALPKQDKEQAPRWIQQLTRFLVTDSPAANGIVRWIVLDGFREKVPSLDVQEFIAQLAACVQSHDAFRLILLNYTQLLPLTVRPFSFADVVEKMTDEEIGVALTDIHGRIVGRPITAQECQEYLVTVQGRLHQYEHDYPEQINNQLLIHSAISDIVESIDAE
jgi:hypothetical protein